MRRFVRRKSSSAGTACAWPPALYAMVTMTAETTAMKRSAHQAQPAHAALGSSAATTPSVSRLCGAAMETLTAEINQTSCQSAVTAGTSRRSLTARLESSSVVAESASISTGNVMATQTARTSPTRQTVVSKCAISIRAVTHKASVEEQTINADQIICERVELKYTAKGDRQSPTTRNENNSLFQPNGEVRYNEI